MLACGKPILFVGRPKPVVRFWIATHTSGCENIAMQGGGTRVKDVGDSDDDDLFKVRSNAAAERPANDLEADNAVDTAVLSMADLDLDRWQADGAMEALRDRFVTGESSVSVPISRPKLECT